MTASRLGCRRGILLPTALLLVLALVAATTSVLVLARTELLLERGDLMYLQRRVAEEVGNRVGTWMGSGADESHGPTSHGMKSDEVGLGGGFVLMRPTGEETRPASVSVHWRLEPEAVVAEMPAALEVGAWPDDGGPIEGVAVLGVGCPSTHSAPLTRLRPDAIEVPADPPISAPPWVGILGIDELLTLPGIGLVPGSHVLPSADAGLGARGPAILRAMAGSTFNRGESEGVLVSPGDLVFQGTARFRGLVILSGDLHLAENARIDGVVLAGGTAHLRDNGRLLGCASLAAAVLDHPDLARAHRIRGGDRLGRY